MALPGDNGVADLWLRVPRPRWRGWLSGGLEQFDDSVVGGLETKCMGFMWAVVWRATREWKQAWWFLLVSRVGLAP